MKIIAAFAVGLALVALLSAAPAQAQATRTFVSPTGNDASVSCSLAAPCRTFLAAYALTNPGGEIAVLGTAGYGPLTISKAISIVNGGGFEAGIAVPSGGIGITINAGPGDKISLRGLTIEGAGVGFAGIQFNIGGTLTVQNCIVRHFISDGIDFLANASSYLLISNTFVGENGGRGILVSPTGSGNTVTAVLNRVETSDNGGDGFFLNGSNSTGTVDATIADSVAAQNQGNGFATFTQSGHSATRLMVLRSVTSYNGAGIAASGTGSATLRISQSTITGNASGWSGSGVFSYGDNKIDGNTANESAPTLIGSK